MGHFNPILSICKKLVERGHDVEIITAFKKNLNNKLQEMALKAKCKFKSMKITINLNSDEKQKMATIKSEDGNPI
jgi:UDP:flavonoid glycosyltransferase YjiC (YdhE family)